jgi:hypothetical protein
MSIHSGWMWLFGRSSGFLGAEVDDTRVSSWRRHHAGLYMTAKLSHMGVDVGGLACPLHHPTVCGHQTRDRTFCQTLCYAIVLQWVVAPFQGCETPGLGYLMEC